MRPLSEMPRETAAGLLGVLTDFDGTLTTNGRLEAPTYQALWRLREAGLRVVIVTGRSAGWADMMIRTFPVDAVVAENGGVTLVPGERGPAYEFATPRGRLARDRRALVAAARAVRRRVPRARIARDSAYTLVDMAFDHGEEARLRPAEIGAIEETLRRRGITAVRSSVHVNFWRGRFSKLTAAKRLIARHLGGAPRSRFAFVGDSANDAPMFEGFPVSVGVANVRDSLDRLPTPPAFVTQGREGRGFEELVAAVMNHRR